MNIFKRQIKSEKGIALILVLSAIAILTATVVEFDYGERVHYRMAVNSAERLQAYYLARSGLNFSKILLKYQKEAEKMLEKGGSVTEGMQVEPLYRMMPLSSELIRGLIGGGGETGKDGETEAAVPEEEAALGAEGEEEESLTDQMNSGVSTLDKQKAEEFLSFKGDFEAEITEEQTKYDLNKIAGIVSSSVTYDQRKKLLLSILKQSEFEDAFGNRDQDAEQLVHALADWVDANGMINEFENVQRGSEDGAYGKAEYKVKNGKFMTLSEARLVAGMNDEIFEKLKPYVTIYPNSEKVNACLGDNLLAASLIHHYTANAGCTQAVEFTDKEKMEELVSALISGCPDAAAMGTAVNRVLGLVEPAEPAATDSASSTDTTTGSTSVSTDKSGAKVPGCAFQLSDLLTSDNKVFNVKAIGTVGETQVVLNVVLNTDNTDPDKWKYYYYRVE